MSREKEAISNETISLISGITHDTPHIEEKIRFFADSIDLLSKSLNTPFANKNINSKILVKIIYNLLTCPNGMRRKYIEHHYENYKILLSPTEDYFVKKFYPDLFKKLNQELQQYLSNKNYDTTTLSQSLKEIIDVLDANYLEKVVEELILVVLCKESLDKHDHKNIIECCTNVIISEYSSIGYSSNEIMEVFDSAIKHNLEQIDEMYRNEIYQIPVPKEIFLLKKDLTLTKYKNKVKKHLKQSNLKVQFQNIVYLYNQAAHQRSFIFKIQNAQLAKDKEGKELFFEYNGVRFESSFFDKYIKKDTRKGYKNYLKRNENYIFAEVEVFSGNQTQALEMAIRKVKEALNYLNYNLHLDINFKNKSTKAYLDLSEYASINVFWSFITRKFIIPIKRMSVDAMQEIKALEDNKSNPVFANYLNLDKVFFEAMNATSNAYMISDLWRYTESLFDGFQKPDEIIDRVLSYHSSKSLHLKNYGLFQRCHFFLYQYLHNQKFEELGYTRDQWWQMLNGLNLMDETINPLEAVIKHPLIKSLFERVHSIPIDEMQKAINDHYHLILRNCNIQRNLFQHSNFIIEEMEMVWLNELIYFMIGLRSHIIKDLINNPGKTIDELIPKVPSTNRK